VYNERLSEALSVQGKLDPVSLASATPTSGGSVDFSKFKRGIWIIDVGVFGASATVDAKLQVSADNSSFTDLATAAPTVTGAAITQLVAAGGNGRIACLEVRAEQVAMATTGVTNPRYARVLITVGTAATLVSCVALGGEPIQKPASQYDLAAVAQKQVVSGPS
jgi:hypothetical protein